MALEFRPEPYWQAFEMDRSVQEQMRQKPFQFFQNMAGTSGEIATMLNQLRRQKLMEQMARDRMYGYEVPGTPDTTIPGQRLNIGDLDMVTNQGQVPINELLANRMKSPTDMLANAPAPVFSPIAPTTERQQPMFNRMLAQRNQTTIPGTPGYRVPGEMELDAMRATASLKDKGMTTGPGGETVNFDDETKLRNEFVTASKQFSDISQSYQRIQDSVTEPSAAGDLSLIYNYMKMLDPGSVVREGEFATAQNSAGVPERIRSQYNSVVNGERLSPNTRNDFFSRAGKLYKGQENLHKTREGEYTRIAKEYGVNPSRVIVNIRSGKPPATSGGSESGGRKVGRFTIEEY